ncbi:DUF4880 domain-containing protein [Allopusillimonas ginsengisoli]|nr:DUF4880 domain-containing protein [Allopusillimonas ginsengisoli]
MAKELKTQSARASEEAARWVVRKESGNYDPETAAAFEAWYQASPQHAHAYDALASTWKKLEGVSQTSLARQRKANLLSKVTLGACLLLGGASLFLHGFEQRGVVSSGVEITRINLPDGSVAILDVQTRIKLVFKEDQRQVRLESGRALFEVRSKEPGSAAFFVATKQATATALGTRYEVGYAGDLTSISVYEHAVKVACTRCVSHSDEIVRQGDAAKISNTSLTVTSGAPHSHEGDTPAWTRGLRTFDDVAAPEAIEVLGQYTHRLIIMASAKVKSARVSGVVNAQKPAAALKLLLAEQDVHVLELPGVIVVY